MAAKISVIIPVYNVAVYLEKCLWSVTNQTFGDIEIIIVNDGSTDNSLAVIEKYAACDSRIKIISKENEGLAFARKTGLEYATGDYIHHLDGDDYIELNCYEQIYKKAIETDADIAVMKFLFENIDNGEVVVSDSYSKSQNSNLEFLHNIWSGHGYFCVWQFIHKRSLYENNILFCKELSFGEDIYLVSQLAYYSSRVVFLDLPLHHYIIRNTSISNKKMTSKKADNTFLYPRLIREFMQNKPEYKSMQEDLSALEVQSCLILLREHYYKGASANCRHAINIMKQYPDIAQRNYVRPFKKVLKVFALNHIAGVIYANYYRKKGKL